MAKINEKDLLDILFELTHIKNEEGEDVPNFCFASDISVDADMTEEDIAVLALKNNYQVYKVFPGETMLGGLAIVADGATKEPVENMYKEFYGEIPEISELKLDDEDNLIEVEEIEEDFDLHPIEITDEDRFGDIEAFENEYKRKAEELGASIEFHTKVGPERLDSSWYQDEDIATIKYKDYIINIFGLGDDVYILWNDEDIAFEDFESYGIYNDKTIPDCEDMGYSGIEFSIKKGKDGEPYSSYGDLDYETAWDLKSALDIEFYINDVIPYFEENFVGFEENVGEIDESKNKRPKIRVRDPNAEAMWGRTRHRVELPKKGKGSFKRHPKHKVDEAYFTPEPDDVERFTELLKQNGWTIESIHEVETFLDDAKKVHIQVIDNTTFPVDVPENATDQEKYEAHRRYCDDLGHADEVWGRADELDEIIHQFDPERKYHITYASSFGGTSHTGVDCTGKITAGIDLRPYVFDDEFNTTLRLGEGKKKTKNPLKAAAEKHKKSNSKKHAMGWFIMPNVEQSIQAFNHANNAPGAESTITAPAGLGEDLDLAITDNYAWDFDSANKYLTVNYRFDDATGRYTNDKYYFARIPETAFKVSRDEYKTNKLLKRRKNKRVLDGVEKFFAEHPKSKWCIISCRDISRSEPGRFVNAYRVLDEDLDLNPVDIVINKNILKYLSDEFDDYKIKTPAWHLGWASIDSLELSEDDLLTLLTELQYEDCFSTLVYDNLADEGWNYIKKDTTFEDAYNAFLSKLNVNEEAVLGLDLSKCNLENHPGVEKLISNTDYIVRGQDVFGLFHRYWDTEVNEDLELVPTTLTNDGYVRPKDFEEGSSFILEGVQAEAFVDDLVPYLIDNLSKTREQQRIELWNEYDIRVINSYNKTKEDDRGFIELEKDDKYVYITVTPNFWLDATADVFMPIEDFKKVFDYVVDVDRIPDSIPGKTINPDLIQNVNESVCTVLEKVEKHDILNPKLWDENNQLKPEVREAILQIVKDFTDGLENDGIKFKVKDIVLVGSNCSYNYNEKSDLDIHIRMDTDSLECPDNLYPLLYGAYRALYNNKMDIDFYGIPVEIYIETDDTQQLSEPVDNQE